VSAEPYYLGVDWCADGWLAVAYTAAGFDHAGVFPEVGQLWSQYEERAERALIDVPIGLRESGSEPRPPEPLAREVLRPRSASVFTPPVREATRKQSYRAATRVNERKADRGLSKQAHTISPGIAAVDELLRAIDEARDVVRESHPEVCFRAFAGEPLAHSKKTAAGYAERMRTLAGFDPDAAPTVQSTAEATADHEVAVDDVLDAVVLGLTARPGPGELRTLPPDPPTDAEGLPMEMVYRAESPLAA
jgi:predicted RNase H-like nuclease